MASLFHLTIGPFTEQPRLKDVFRGAFRRHHFVEIIIIILRTGQTGRAVTAGARVGSSDTDSWSSSARQMSGSAMATVFCEAGDCAVIFRSPSCGTLSSSSPSS